MIWQSTTLMTIIDLLLIAIAGAAVLTVSRHRNKIGEAGRNRGPWVIAAGLVLVGLFYLADLWTMWVLPVYSSPDAAHASMMDLHLSYSWVAVLVAMATALLGLMRTVDGLSTQELATEATEHRYRMLFEQSADGILLRRASDGSVRAVNDAVLEMTGYSRSEMEVSDPGFLVHPDSREAFVDMTEELRARQRARASITLRTRSGGRVKVDLNCSRVTADGEDHYLSLFRDVTAERRAQEAVRTSEAKYRSLFEESMDLIYVSTPENELIDINPAGLELLGYESLDELRSGIETSGLYTDPEQREERDRLIEAQGFLHNHEAEMRTRGGRRIITVESATAVTGKQGETTFYRGIVRDVTTQRELETQLRQSEKMRAVGRLAGGIAHDFNNLLTAILGYSQLAIDRVEKDDDLRDDLTEIREAGERAAALTRQLLAFSRQQVLQPEIIDLNWVTADMEKLLRRTIGADIELVTDLDPDLGRVQVDRAQFEQVLMNLAINARDAMPGGGQLRLATANVEPARPRAAAADATAQVRLTVSDNGCGMDKETYQRIFEPFFTTKKRGEGTGLGLATVYGIVKQSGGVIQVQSQPGEGTTFEIFLPRTDEPARGVRPCRRLAKPRPRTETILVLEDEAGVRQLAARVLEEQGHHVMVAQHPDEALRICREHSGRIDLLLTDMVLPEMSGHEVAGKVARLRPETRVLTMSGYADSAEHTDTDGRQMPFLAKPLTPQALVDGVREVLDIEHLNPDEELEAAAFAGASSGSM